MTDYYYYNIFKTCAKISFFIEILILTFFTDFWLRVFCLWNFCIRFSLLIIIIIIDNRFDLSVVWSIWFVHFLDQNIDKLCIRNLDVFMLIIYFKRKFLTSPSEFESHWFKMFFQVVSGIVDPPMIFSNSFLEIDPSPF